MVWFARGLSLLRASALLLILGWASALAKTESDAAPAVSMAALQSADTELIHNELRALKATMERSLTEMDIDTIVANVSDDVIFTTMDGDVARGPAGIRKYFETIIKGLNPRVLKVDSKFEAEDLSNLYGRNFAVVFGSSKDHYELAGGEIFDVTGRWSGTIIHRDGRWLIVNFH
jgi:ketosteroid isomerase-like protein